MIKESGYRMKRRFLKKSELCLITIAIVLLPVFVHEVYTSHMQYYKKSEWFVNSNAAMRLGIKDPNKLTSEDYEKIEDIYLYFNVERSIKTLAKLENLKSISFSFAPDRNIDLRPLVNLKMLNRIEFYIPRVNHIDLRPLGEIKSLKTLKVRSDSGIPFNLRKTRWYEKLFIYLKIYKPSNHAIKPFDFSQLKKLKNLEKLTVQYIDVSNTEDLAGFTNLKYLDLSTARIKNIEPLSGLANLEYLSLSSSDINDISPLANLTNLKTLNLSSMKIENIDTIAALTKLNQLDLSYTQVKDLKVLSKLINLRSLSLLYTTVSDEQITELKNERPGLSIQR